MGDFNRRYATKMFFASNFRGLKHHGYRHAIATRFRQIAPGRISAGAPFRLDGPGRQSALYFHPQIVPRGKNHLRRMDRCRRKADTGSPGKTNSSSESGRIWRKKLLFSGEMRQVGLARIFHTGHEKVGLERGVRGANKGAGRVLVFQLGLDTLSGL